MFAWMWLQCFRDHRRRRWLLVSLRSALLVLLLSPAAQAQMPAPEKLQLCASCHGVNGQSSAAETPHLAGLQTSYFIRQMEDFRKGRRKSAVMQAVMSGLDDKDVALLATYFREQKPPEPGKGHPSSLRQGKDIFMEGIVANAVPSCAGCHKDDGTGTNRYPRLAGQQPTYLVQQMLNYKSGARDNDDRGLMRAVAQRMTEAEIRAVAEFIVTMKGDEE